MRRKSLKNIGPMLPGLEMCESAEETTSQQLTLFAEDFPALTYRWLGTALDWLESNQDSGGSSIELLRSLRRDGLLLRTSPAFCRQAPDGIWEPSSGRWANSGIWGPTGCLTLNTLEWPSDGAACSLSDILEMDVPLRYFLSARAARGILRRAEKKGRKMPPRLREALLAVAGSTHQEGDERTT